VTIPCPITIQDPAGQQIARATTADISDAAAFAPVPIQSVPACGSKVRLRFSVPRQTPNTFLFEQFDSSATVVRHQLMADDHFAGVALLFDRPLPLHLAG